MQQQNLTKVFDETLPDEAATRRFAQDVAAAILPGDLIALYGDLGAGKTAFCRALIRNLAGDDQLEVPSPTFSLLQPYELRIPVRHFDLYRLADPEELEEIGFFDEPDTALTLVEWPARAGDMLPEHHMTLSIDILAGDARSVQLSVPEAQKARFERTLAARRFLASAGHGSATRSHVQGDASHRSYERISNAGQTTTIFMNAPETPPGDIIEDGKSYADLVHRAADTRPFSAMAEALLKLGFSAPSILSSDHVSGFLLLEDFGKEGIVDSDAQPIKDRYLAAIDVLAALHDKGPALSQMVDGPYTIPAFDRTAFLTEVALFADWYAPYCDTQLQAQEQQDFTTLWSDLFDELKRAETGFILRDVHSPNLMWLADREPPQQIGLLDFQDALWGPQLYDLSSLVYDARITISSDFRKEMLDRYQSMRKTPLERADMDKHLAILGAQRTMKILGIFARLASHDAKMSYVAHMPRNEDYLREMLAHEAMGAVRHWYETHLGNRQRN
ncbi:tRNA (adenosine(37)-N6)-threonylcarbamoyltransferase complex ATPase subunit type 1 TsaE [Pararhizobium sp. IMCC21322]|uniref:tRNA (adenosine(37)-N6)-threonylcarbamoyltransferase complex ATPase subunit type 1 TsaE n=1 Tax=Pararhizobium sp. IMCC21322 TaxID=3067903 RepID=UPI002741E67E|nr:tRNA (adenosine(37)-N6)-threonylcarbamoyltransferase complex ATPase subunit type 1 TsaE [Pararhizobium sp. IMCC21322]